MDFVQKPTALATEKLMRHALRPDREGEGGGRDRPTSPCERCRRPGQQAASPLPGSLAPKPRAVYDVVVIGVSTGGPQGLKAVIPQLPSDSSCADRHRPAHADGIHTDVCRKARRLVSRCTSSRRSTTEEVMPGTVYLAPAGRHLLFRRRRGSIGPTARHPAARLRSPALGRRACSNPLQRSTVAARSGWS